MQDATNEAVEMSLRLLRTRLDRLTGRIATELVSKEDFRDLLTGWMAAISRSQREEKLRAAANLVANQMLRAQDPDRIEPAEADLFMRAIEQLSRDAIAVLVEACRMGNAERRGDPRTESVRLQFTGLCSRFSKTDPHLLVAIIGELDGFGLLHRDSRPAVRMANYEDQPFDLTPLGTRFVERLVAVE